MKKQFEIELLNIQWIDGFKDNSTDLCAHGNVYVRINDEIISDKNSMQWWTVSATALYLLRTLCENYEPYKYGNYLLPCCGHFFVKELNKPVLIMGCNRRISYKKLQRKRT